MHTDKSKADTHTVAASNPVHQKRDRSTFQFADNRPAAASQRRLQQLADNSTRSTPPGPVQAKAQSALGRGPVSRAKTIQRAEILKDGKWEDLPLDFGSLTAEQIGEIRGSLFTMLNPAGIYKLSASELRALNKRDSEIYNSAEAQEARAQKAAKDDKSALDALEVSLGNGEPWALTGKPSHMGVSDKGFSQNWEIAVQIGAGTGVLHMHFDTNVPAEVSELSLGKAHIKTHLASKVGNIAAPKPMVDQGIALVPKI